MDEYDVRKKFRQDKIMAIEKLAQLLQCSAITVRRRLKKWKTFTSINQNGRYYTLPEIPEFDDNGLWKYQFALFSKHGNLKQTIIELVKDLKLGSVPLIFRALLRSLQVVPIFHKSSNPTKSNEKNIRAGLFIFQRHPTNINYKKRGAERHKTDGWPTDTQAVKILVHIIKTQVLKLTGLPLNLLFRVSALTQLLLNNFCNSMTF
ncbi:hypothetical protein [Desulfobacter hydrogenophilus]|uniref:hypothetical protein n=1 Tax=Desulfobacter hydrogenophilus TaxID=2291 RepID=UPI001A9529EE|nr:hypothetical protein [Desulfobacter hydrogenophilus]